MFNQADLDQFTGTEHWYRTLSRKVVYTDGVKYLAEQAKAYWLIDEITAAQSAPALRNHPFQVWTMTVKDNKGDIRVTDGNDNAIYAQSVPYTDFPVDSVTVWVEDGGPGESRVILLPSEH